MVKVSGINVGAELHCGAVAGVWAEVSDERHIIMMMNTTHSVDVVLIVLLEGLFLLEQIDVELVGLLWQAIVDGLVLLGKL